MASVKELSGGKQVKGDFLKDCVILDITFCAPSDQKNFKAGEVEVVKAGGKNGKGKANQSLVRASRQIIDSDDYKAAVLVGRHCRLFLEKLGHDFPLRRGSILMPVTHLDQAIARIKEDEAKYLAYADKVAAEYTALIEKAQEELGELFDPNAYHSPERFRYGFRVRKSVTEFVLPESSKIGALAKDNESSVNSQLDELAVEITAGLRSTFKQLIDVLANALRPSHDGSKHRLNPNSYANLKEFLDMFSAKNLLGDSDLEKLVEKARKVIDGDFEGLKDNQPLRDYAGKILGDVQSKVKELVEKAPGRKMKF